MSTHTKITIASLSLLLSLVNPGLVFATALPQEPDDQLLVNEDVNIITGLYTREYSLHNDGVIDYKTARQIVISELNEYWNSVVETKEHPLFYWHDSNHDGQFTMWVDRGGDGCDCDIIRYDSNP